MLDILKIFNYTIPNFNVTNDKPTGPPSPKTPFEIRKTPDDIYILYINGVQWMMYEFKNHYQVSQVFSHYYLASGDVITTGLGFGAREKWILNNPKVKSLTVLEQNEDLIKFHRDNNPELFENANIIHCDAKTYKGKCDTLLLDHYEWEPMTEIISDVKNICDNNIECNQMWFWHLETQILADLHNLKDVDNICGEFRNGNFKIDISTLQNIKSIYDTIRNTNNLTKLPESITQEELQLILSIYTHFFQKL